MFKKILVPLDGSEVAPEILPFVSYLAKSLALPVTLSVVMDPDAQESSQEVSAEDIGGEDVLAAEVTASGEAQRYLRGYLESLAQEGIQAESAVAVADNPAEKILNLSNEYGCDLIAMATRDRNFLNQEIMGSVTNDVLRSSQIPVVAMTPERSSSPVGEQSPLSSILVPIDGTELGESALPYVEYLARELSLEVLLVRVLQMSDVYPSMIGAPAPSDEGTARVHLMAEEAAEQEAAEYLESIAAKLNGKGLSVRWELAQGDTPSHRIIELANELTHNMIVLASHGHSGLTRWVMGSVAEDVIRGTGDPVLVVPSDQP